MRFKTIPFTRAYNTVLNLKGFFFKILEQQIKYKKVIFDGQVILSGTNRSPVQDQLESVIT